MPTNAVIYARYSSHNQREESIDGQLRKCYAFAEQHDLTVIEEYIDRALSGKTDNRADFQRMIRDSDKGNFQVVIMYTMDRFARNRYDSAIYKAKLKKNGVKIYYTEQSITDEPEGIILESLLEGMAEYYSENLSRGVRRGMKENALKCMSTGGQIPFGYKISPDKKYEIDQNTVHIVREMFELYAGGKTQRQIVDILNGKGYRTRKGTLFRVGSITRMLSNKKYIGIYKFDDVEIENGVPAIIDEALFNRVQEMLVKNKKGGARMKAPVPYLLTGKLYCGHCGSPMVGESGTSHTGTTYTYYKCSERKKKGTCRKCNEKKDWLEKLIVQETVQKILQPGVIDNISLRVAELAEKEFNDTSRLIALQTEFKGVQTSIRNLLRLVEQGIDTEDVGGRLLDLSTQKEDLQKEIAKEETKKPALTKDRISYWLTAFVSNGNTADPEYCEKIIDTLVNKVFVFDTDNGGKKIAITYNTSNNLQSTVTLSDIQPYVNNSDIKSEAPPK